MNKSNNERLVSLLKYLIQNDTTLLYKLLEHGLSKDDVNMTSLSSSSIDLMAKTEDLLAGNDLADPSGGSAIGSTSATGGGGSTSSVGVRLDVCTNASYNRGVYYDLTQIPWVRYTFVVVYLVLTVLSFLGNLMVIWTVSRNRHMRTVTNYYIRNLAVCDLLVAACVMPLKLLEYTAPCTWHVFAKDALCSVVYYILPVFVFASVLTLVAISLERCHAIVNPFSAMTMHSKSRTRAILIATWLIPLVLASPYLYCRSYAFTIESPYGSISRQICTDRFSEIDVAIYGKDYIQSGRFRKGFFIFISVTMYLIPMVVIVVTCIRIAACLLRPMDADHQLESSYGMKITRKRGESKRRVARMIITIAIAFIVCWTPFYLVSFISQLQSVSFLQKSNFIFTMLATHLSGFLNSAINPFIYHFMSEKFRKSFISILRSFLCCPLHLWQKKGERTFSWAVKCEEDYCQHRFEKQRSTSSHSHSKQDFGGHPMVKFKSINPANQQAKANSRQNPEKHSALTHSPAGKGIAMQDQYNQRKDVTTTIVKNKQSTSLYCGPFCVCECQGCSIQSSSSQPSSSHPSTKIPVPAQPDTLTEYQSLIHQSGKRQPQSVKQRNSSTKMELQSLRVSNKSGETGAVAEERTSAFNNRTSALNNRTKTEKTTGRRVGHTTTNGQNGMSLNEAKTSYQSHSDSNIYQKKSANKMDNMPKTSLSSNHLLLPAD